jgi:hypothetical protein
MGCVQTMKEISIGNNYLHSLNKQDDKTIISYNKLENKENIKSELEPLNPNNNQNIDIDKILQKNSNNDLDVIKQKIPDMDSNKSINLEKDEICLDRNYTLGSNKEKNNFGKRNSSSGQISQNKDTNINNDELIDLTENPIHNLNVRSQTLVLNKIHNNSFTKYDKGKTYDEKINFRYIENDSIKIFDILHKSQTNFSYESSPYCPNKIYPQVNEMNDLETLKKMIDWIETTAKNIDKSNNSYLIEKLVLTFQIKMLAIELHKQSKKNEYFISNGSKNEIVKSIFNYKYMYSHNISNQIKNYSKIFSLIDDIVYINNLKISKFKTILKNEKFEMFYADLSFSVESKKFNYSKCILKSYNSNEVFLKNIEFLNNNIYLNIKRPDFIYCLKDNNCNADVNEDLKEVIKSFSDDKLNISFAFIYIIKDIYLYSNYSMHNNNSDIECMNQVISDKDKFVLICRQIFIFMEYCCIRKYYSIGLNDYANYFIYDDNVYKDYVFSLHEFSQINESLLQDEPFFENLCNDYRDLGKILFNFATGREFSNSLDDIK